MANFLTRLLEINIFTMLRHSPLYRYFIALREIYGMFVPRFPGTVGQMFWYISQKVVKTLEKSIRNSRGIVTPADPRDVMSNVASTTKCPSLVQSGVLTIPKISAVNITLALPALSGQYNVMQYLARLCTYVK